MHRFNERFIRRTCFLPLALVLAGVVAGCGSGGKDGDNEGDSGTAGAYSIGGVTTGLQGTSVLLQNGAATLRITGNGSFVFPDKVASGTAFNLIVQSQPRFPEQTCTVLRGSGTVAAADVTDIRIECENVPARFNVPFQALTVQASTTENVVDAIKDGSRDLTIANPDASSFYYSIAFNGTAVRNVPTDAEEKFAPTLQSPSAPNHLIPAFVGGKLTITGARETVKLDGILMNEPATLGAGTYSDTIIFRACYDAACVREVRGSPVEIPVTYVVTGAASAAALDLPTAHATIFRQLEDASTSLVQRTVTVDTAAIALPPDGAYVFAKGMTGNLIASTSALSVSNTDINPPPIAAARISATLKAPATLTAGIYSEAVQVTACFDAACTRPLGGSPWTVNIRYLVRATEGVDYSVKKLAVTPGEIVWDRTSSRLYAMIRSGSPNCPNSIAQIDPVAGSIERCLQLQGGARFDYSLAISDDGQYLYAAATDISGLSHSIERIHTATLSTDVSIPMPPFETARRIEVAPGSPLTFAVVTSYQDAHILVYDGTVPRSQGFGPSTVNNFIEWSADATALFVAEGFHNESVVHEFALTAGGLTSSIDTPLPMPLKSNTDDVKLIGDNLYWDTGYAFDTKSRTLQQSFPKLVDGGYSFAAAHDAATDRSLFETSEYFQNEGVTYATVTGFRTSDRQPVWIARFPSHNLNPLLVRWGSDGLSLVVNEAGMTNLLFVSGSVINK